jgi:transposase
MEKKYENLGETKISNENIESSINKLKNLKR